MASSQFAAISDFFFAISARLGGESRLFQVWT
jgi:hypothetical protein